MATHSYLCPHCEKHCTIGSSDYSCYAHRVGVDNKIGEHALISTFVVCQNPACKKCFLDVDVKRYYYVRQNEDFNYGNAKLSMRLQSAKSATIPKDLEALDDRLTRLRARLAEGDPDMEPDELQAAIATVETKRAELIAMRPETKKSARILSLLPKAAANYRKQVQAGIDGDEQATARAHLILRDLLGSVTLTPGKIRRAVGFLSVEPVSTGEGDRESWSG